MVMVGEIRLGMYKIQLASYQDPASFVSRIRLGLYLGSGQLRIAIANRSQMLL